MTFHASACAIAAREMKRAPDALTQVNEAGVFEGYASVFGEIDLGRDLVERGAFLDSLARRPAASVKMLWQHDGAEPIGTWLSIAEDARGLRVRGRLNLAVARAREVLSLMREGAVDGLSIGFHARKSAKDPRTGVRRLQRIDLWEISIVTFPMAPQARVTAVKRLADAAHWRAAATTLEWRAAAMALEAKFVAARKDVGGEAPSDSNDPGSSAGSANANANDNWRNQPRAPAGSPEGGQWVSDGGGGDQIPRASSAQVILANLTCEDLLDSDWDICKSVVFDDDPQLRGMCVSCALLRNRECLDGLALTPVLPY